MKNKKAVLWWESKNSEVVDKVNLVKPLAIIDNFEPLEKTSLSDVGKDSKLWAVWQKKG